MDFRHSRSLKLTAPATQRADKDDRDFVTALGRGLVVLRAFGGRNRELGSAEIASLVGLPQPTVWRLCNTLVEHRLLSRMRGSDKLRVGPLALKLAKSFLESKTVLSLLRPHMRAIQSLFEGAISLAARDGLEMVILERVHKTMFMTPQRIGGRVPIGRSSLGLVHLCASDPEERATLLAALQRTGNAPAVDFGSAIQSFSSDGFVITRGALFPEISAVAVAMRCPDHGEVLAMSCVARSADIRDELMYDLGHRMVALAKKFDLLIAL